MMLNTNGNLTDQGNKIFEAIWGNESLRESLFPTNNTEPLKPMAINDFKEMVSNIGSSFFKFIKVK